MKAHRLFQRLLGGFLGFVLLAGLGGQFLHPRHELFPFYSWFLFSLVPQPEPTVFELLIHEAPVGTVFDPPISYRRLNEGTLRSPHSIDLYRNVQELGRAAQARDVEASDRLRAGLERRFRMSGPVRYEIVRQTYADPMARWSQRDTAPFRQESVATFQSGVDSAFPAAPGAPPAAATPPTEPSPAPTPVEEAPTPPPVEGAPVPPPVEPSPAPPPVEETPAPVAAPEALAEPAETPAVPPPPSEAPAPAPAEPAPATPAEESPAAAPTPAPSSP